MAALDFKEIPTAQAGTSRDQFELFAREFLVNEGFVVVDGPDRGADAGRDIIVEEKRTGPGGENKVRWLVSCKHNAHTGISVREPEERNLRDRIETHECDGFIAFYSTIPSSGLRTQLRALQPKYDLVIYDSESIERRLLDSPRGRTLAARFLPTSFNAWIHQSQYALRDPSPDPQHIQNTFFLREPHSKLTDALKEASVRGLLVFVVIYDPTHSQRSRIHFCLGYFMEYQTTKKLVDQYFVVMVGPSSDAELSVLVPDDDPLERCLWVVLNPAGEILRRESVYANGDEGMKRVREVIRAHLPTPP